MKQALWLIILACIGAIAAFAQLDRQSRYEPSLAVFVPDQIAGFALAHDSRTALDRQDISDALAQTQALLARRPMPAEHLRLLTEAQLLSGSNKAANRSLQLAGQRGWRDPIAQRAMLALAQRSGNHAQATRRYLALWITGNDRAQLARLAASVFQAPEAQEEAVRLLASRKIWQNGFVCNGMPQLLPAHAAGIERRLEAAGAEARCIRAN